jgi:hypothetical protein
MGVSRIRSVTLSAGAKDSGALGMRAASGWLEERRIHNPSLKRWHVEVSLATIDGPAPINYDDRVDTRFHVDIYSEEWGFFFCHAGRASWIRITDIPFVHGRDDFKLLSQTPALSDVRKLLRSLETQHQLAFKRKHALVRTNVAGAEAAVRAWVESL